MKKKPLTKAQKKDLKKSGLEPEDWERAGYYMTHGVTKKGTKYEKLMIPYFDPSDGTPIRDYIGDELVDFVRWKNPDGIKPRYSQNSGTPNHLYHPILPDELPDGLVPWPEYMKDTSIDILFVEGEKKADCACKHGIQVVSLPGVNSDKCRELERYRTKDRNAAMLYDSDFWDKPEIQAAARSAARNFQAKGGKNFYAVVVPGDASGKKVGLDDYIVKLLADGIKPEDISAKVLSLERTRIVTNSSELRLLPSMAPILPKDFITKATAPPKHVIERYLPENEASMLTGTGGTGKTQVAAWMAVSVTTGRPFVAEAPNPTTHDRANMGFEVRKPGKVLIIALEGTLEDLQWRIQEQIKAMKLNKEEKQTVTNDLRIVVSRDPMPMVTTEQYKTVLTRHYYDYEELVLNEKPRLVIIDPMISILGDAENDNAKLNFLIAHMTRPILELHAALLLLDHTGKDQRDDQYAGRGGSSKTDRSRSVMNSNVMNEAIAKNHGVVITADEEEMGSVICLRHNKLSTGKKHKPLYLERRDSIALHYKEMKERAVSMTPEERLGEFMKWADKQTKGFTKSQAKNDKILRALGYSEEQAAAAVDDAVKAGRIKLTGEKRKSKKPNVYVIVNEKEKR